MGMNQKEKKSVLAVLNASCCQTSWVCNRERDQLSASHTNTSLTILRAMNLHDPLNSSRITVAICLYPPKKFSAGNNLITYITKKKIISTAVTTRTFE